MKKSVLALAVLGAFAGAASAQSSVTLYGRVDLSFSKQFGSELKNLANGSGSRLGVRGVEDLGGGLAAVFNIENRFNADNGGLSDVGRLFGGRSVVGFRGGFGQVLLGREYTPAFLQSQVVADPWGWDTSNAVATAAVTGGGIALVRADSSITYTGTFGGFTIGAQYGEGTDFLTVVSPNPGPPASIGTIQVRSGKVDNPISFAVSYAGGPIVFGVGYEATGQVNDPKWTTVNGSFDFGIGKLGGFYGTGDNISLQEVEAYLISWVMPIGGGEFRSAYGTRERANVKDIDGFLLGYHYNLSKRTTIYADYGRNGKQPGRTSSSPAGYDGSKTGYDFGVKHNF